MKRGWRVLLVVVACVVVAVTVALVWPKEREPEYQGRKLSEWLDDYKGIPGQPLRVTTAYAGDAIHRIGTNGVPFLVRWIRETRRVSGWRSRLIARINRGGLRRVGGDMLVGVMARPQLQGGRGLLGFQILGEDARSAVPELAKIANNGNEWSAMVAIDALGCTGKDAVRPLMAMVSNKRFRFRQEAIRAMARVEYFGTNAHAVAELLVRCLEDPKICVPAADLLGRLSTEKEVAVPAFVKALGSTNPMLRSWAAIALGTFGEDAQAAVPALRSALNDSDISVQFEARKALERIAPEVLRKRDAVQKAD